MYGETEQTALYKMPKNSSIPKVSTIITKTPNAYDKILHDNTHKSTQQQTYFIHDDNGDPILDPETTANKFNEFFTSLHKDLSSSGNSSRLSNSVDSKVPERIEFDIPPFQPH